MAIGSAIQRGLNVYVYNEKGVQINSFALGNSSDCLKGYTATTVTIQRGQYIYTFDEKGRQIGNSQFK